MCKRLPPGNTRNTSSGSWIFCSCNLWRVFSHLTTWPIEIDFILIRPPWMQMGCGILFAVKHAVSLGYVLHHCGIRCTGMSPRKPCPKRSIHSTSWGTKNACSYKCLSVLRVISYQEGIFLAQWRSFGVVVCLWKIILFSYKPRKGITEKIKCEFLMSFFARDKETGLGSSLICVALAS